MSLVLRGLGRGSKSYPGGLGGKVDEIKKIRKFLVVWSEQGDMPTLLNI